MAPASGRACLRRPALALGIGFGFRRLFGRSGMHCECRNARYFRDRAAFGKDVRKAEAL